MNNILINGCSFTQSRINDRPDWINSDRSWIPYSDLLYHEYKDKIEVTNLGLDSASNGLIYNNTLNELIKKDFKYDFVITQWSAVMRAHTKTVEEFSNSLPTGTIEASVHFHEYLLRGKMELGEVTNTLNRIESSFYTHTLLLIYSLQQILKSQNIPYFMFWGWEQITDEVYDTHRYIFDKIYNNNFWRFNLHGGMNEYIIDLIGKKHALISHDFHPSTKGHKLFYEDIIKPLIK
jgi:hypothetical protein